MKKVIILLLAVFPLMVSAQTDLTPEQEMEKAQKELEAAQKRLAEAQERMRKAKESASEEPQKAPEAGWSVPQEEEQEWAEPGQPAATKAAKPSKAEELAPYLAPEAVPMVDGKVEWSCTVEAPGENAGTLYGRCRRFLNDLIHAENSQKESRVALLNEQGHSVIASMREWLTFSTTYLSLNRTTFGYVLQATCADGRATLTMSRLTYNYDLQGKHESFKAEEWITDEVALNKERTRLLPLSGKMRRKTIDRKNELFKQFENAIKDK